MFLELLQYGEYTIGRPGKTNYAKYTYTIDNRNIIFKIDPKSHDLESARIKLYKEIITLGFVYPISNGNTEIHLAIDCFNSNLKLLCGNELPAEFDAIRLLLDLTNNLNLEKTLKRIVNKTHPLLTVSEDYDGNCSYKISPYISTGLSEHIITVFQERLGHYLNHQPKYINRDISEVVILENSENQFGSLKIIKVTKNTQQDLTQFLQEKSEDIKNSNSWRETALALGNSRQNSTIQTGSSHRQIYESLSTISYTETFVGRKILITSFANHINSALENEKIDYKNVCLSLITQMFYKLTDLAEIANLFDHLLGLQAQLDIHKNPRTDRFFRIKNTDSWKDMMGKIRNHAFTLFENEHDQCISRNDNNSATKLLTDYRNRNIFAAHRANGLLSLGNTEAVNDIDVKLAPKPLTK